MVGQATTMIYLNELRETLDKEIKNAEIGTGEVVRLTIRDIAIRDALKVIQGEELIEEESVDKSIMIDQQKLIIDELMRERKELLKYKDLYWSYRDKVDKGC